MREKQIKSVAKLMAFAVGNSIGKPNVLNIARYLVDNGIGELGFHSVCDWWIETYPTSVFKNEVGEITKLMKKIKPKDYKEKK